MLAWEIALRRRRRRQIRLTPREREKQTAARAHQDPGRALPPEHPDDTPRQPAVRTTFGDDGHRSATKCNIRCCLIRG